MKHWRWYLKDLRDRIWFRAALISLLSVLLALAGAILAPVIPYEWSLKVGGDAVDTVLSILASSMLAVTTFSLTAMVAAFSGASQQITPRAVHLLIQDRVAQTALSTFLGGFVFSLVSIVALTTGMYGAQGRIILFVGTIFVAIIIVLTLLRWIARLVNFGRVEDAISLLTAKSNEALSHYPGPLLLAGRSDRPSDAAALRHRDTGYLAHIDRPALSKLARERGLTIDLAIAAGDFIDPTVPLAIVRPEPSDALKAAMVDAFAVSRIRDFDQDPRFGMRVFAEIAVRALSPGVNDPGTAVDVLVAAQQVLQGFARPDPNDREPLPGLRDMSLSFEEMVEELVLPIARDSAGIAEVGMRLQAMLGALARQIPAAEPFLARIADDAMDRHRAADIAGSDLDRVERAHVAAFNPSRVQGV